MAKKIMSMATWLICVYSVLFFSIGQTKIQISITTNKNITNTELTVFGNVTDIKTTKGHHYEETVHQFLYFNNLLNEFLDYHETKLTFFCGFNSDSKYDSLFEFFLNGTRIVHLAPLNNTINVKNISEDFNSIFIQSTETSFMYIYAQWHCIDDIFNIEGFRSNAYIAPKMYIEEIDSTFICYANDYSPRPISMKWLCGDISLNAKNIVVPIAADPIDPFETYDESIKTSASPYCYCIIKHVSLYNEVVIRHVAKFVFTPAHDMDFRVVKSFNYFYAVSNMLWIVPFHVVILIIFIKIVQFYCVEIKQNDENRVIMEVVDVDNMNMCDGDDGAGIDNPGLVDVENMYIFDVDGETRMDNSVSVDVENTYIFDEGDHEIRINNSISVDVENMCMSNDGDDEMGIGDNAVSVL
ncbi:glycoprotein [Murid herpesvirus 3]|uniref:Glycoprotein n=2 Tax=Murid betaherpesvirus 3 TaxID=2560603 RepID=A0A1P8VIU1_9BETA|nr:glycoprotein [Murine roseolovirus]APZ76247.1 glycoprotein [Murid betaherpesvirus 3]AYH64742.1 glycoprotein [Murid herpesvirus 3]